MRCAFGAQLDVGLAERRAPCRFVGNLTFPLRYHKNKKMLGGQRQVRGIGRGAGRGNRENRGRVYFEPGETKICYKCNYQGHLANIFPSEPAGEAESARKRTTPA